MCRSKAVHSCWIRLKDIVFRDLDLTFDSRKYTSKCANNIEPTRLSSSFFSLFIGLIPSIKVSIKIPKFIQACFFENPFFCFKATIFDHLNIPKYSKNIDLSRDSNCSVSLPTNYRFVFIPRVVNQKLYFCRGFARKKFRLGCCIWFLNVWIILQNVLSRLPRLDVRFAFFPIFIRLIPSVKVLMENLLFTETFFIDNLSISFSVSEFKKCKCPRTLLFCFTSRFNFIILRYYKLDFFPPTSKSQLTFF